MKISAREDIQTPIASVFARLTDFAAHEAVAARRGVAVERLSLPQERADKPAWKAVFQYGGREREVSVEVADLHDPDFFSSEVHYQGIDAAIEIELVPLAKTRTRMIVGLELKPRSIKAKLVVQSLKIAKGSIQRRIENRLKSFARELEQQARD
jgi:carbon monoxide dehydrogenase subunit G